MNLYLDDIRQCPDGWVLVRNIREAQKFVEANHADIVHMSLDHDLGLVYCRPCAFSDAETPCLDNNGQVVCGCTCHVPEPSGYDFLKWLHRNDYWPKMKPKVHSANPVGAENMRVYIDNHGPYGK